ncbi:hypothetical protein BBP40_011596, partial [Aspergillus hancockii]
MPLVKPSRICIVGATGRTGRGVLQIFLSETYFDSELRIYVRSRAKLLSLFPGIESYAGVKVFEGSVTDVELLTQCLSGVGIIITTLGENENIPGLRALQDAATTTVSALEILSQTSSSDGRRPRLVLLSSATWNPKFAAARPRPVHWAVRNAFCYTYDDLLRAQAIYAAHPQLLQLCLVQPPALIEEESAGHILSTEKVSLAVSYADLAAGIVEIVTSDEYGDVSAIGVSSASEDQLRHLPEMVRRVVRGLLARYAPWYFAIERKNVDLAPLPTFYLTSLPDERSKTLLSLLQQNHQDYAVLFEPKLLFHNHMPHMLGTAYLLGFPQDKLIKAYQNEAQHLKKLDSGLIRTGVTRNNWRDFFGKKKYTAAYMDFFDQEISNHQGDWKSVVTEYLFRTPQPLIHGFVGGLGHPMIHLAYAYEFCSPEIATEALSLGCTERDPIHRYLDTPYPDTSTYKSTSAKAILQRVHDDPRFSNLFSIPGYANLAAIFPKAESAILEHWNAWDIVKPAAQLKELMQVAGVLLIESRTEAGEYDFFLAHALTVGHAVRVLLPVFPGEWRVDVMRQFWLFVLSVYVAQLRPGVD